MNHMQLGFIKAWEFTLDNRTASPSVCREDVAVNSHHHPSLVRIRLSWVKTDPFGAMVSTFL